jgi:3-dehydroquinate dehydratase / shikimate dehydrogenase
VLAQLQRHSGRRNVIALAMGEAGLATRVLGRKFGAFLTYAALHPGGGSAPGQPTVTELCGVYHWDRIGPATRVYGVVGWPVVHSQSPTIHNAALAEAGIDGVYVPLPVRPRFRDFAAFMACLTHTPHLDIVGLSVTLPHKEHALRWLDRRGFPVTPLARRCGAVNTLTRLPDGTWEGDNTDAPGALAALQGAARCAGNRLGGLQVDILGAGGAARAVVAALLEYDCAVTVYGRTAARAERLAQELRCLWKPWEERRHCAGDVLINCTPVGLWPATEESPLPGEALRPQTLVFDTIYHPVQTLLLRTARARGCEIVSGVPMFIGQAAAQFERWHGTRAPTEVMAGAFRAEAAWQL